MPNKLAEKQEEDKEKRKYASTAYPKNSLLDALRIAQAIKDHSAGKPYDLLDLAKSLGYSPASSGFRQLITTSSRYGLTTGSYKAKEIALTPLGTSIVFPKDPRERAEGLKNALFNIDLFRRFFADYDNNKLPSLEYLTNTLNRTYGIPIEDCKDCYNMIVKNAKELEILDNISGSEWIHLNKLVKPEMGEPTTPVEVPFAESEEEKLATQLQITGQRPQVVKEEKPVVFISHSKNMTIVDQIKTILEFGQFDSE